MAQPGQPVKKPQGRFPWGRTIIIIALMGGLLWWLLSTFLKTETPMYGSEHFQNRISVNADDNDDDNYFEKLSEKPFTSGVAEIYVTEKVDGRTEKYFVRMPRAQWDEISAMDYVVGTKEVTDSTGTNTVNLTFEDAIKHSDYKPEDKTNIIAPSNLPQPNWFLDTLLPSLLPILLFIVLYMWLFRRAGMGATGGVDTSKNQARKIISKVRFNDIAGQEEVKEEVEEVVDFLKNPSNYKAAGARIPKGILLGGPPGTGKTLLAKATAGEAGVPFYFISASNFIEMFAGLGAKRVREMFKEARKASPAILFIDELDAIGRKRGSSLSGNDEREQTLNQILVEMDGMDENTGLLIMAATNRPDVLDPALLRPGRFDRTITVNNPDIRERQLILELHAKGKRIADDVDFARIAKRTPGYSGAQLENIVNEAALLSVREKTGIITLAQIDEAIDRVAAGPAKKSRVISKDELRMVSYHEAGHAVIGLVVAEAEKVQKITIIPRGDAGGYTLMTPKKETYNYKKSELEAKIASFMGGRAAEQIIYGAGEVSTGAHNDIEKATNIARAMVTQYGMSILGPIQYEKAQGSQFLGQDQVSAKYSDSLAEKIDDAIRDLVLKAEKKAITIIKKNKKLLQLISDELMDKETIIAEEIEYIFKNKKRPPKRVVKKISTKAKNLDDVINKVKGLKNSTPEVTDETLGIPINDGTNNDVTKTTEVGVKRVTVKKKAAPKKKAAAKKTTTKKK